MAEREKPVERMFGSAPPWLVSFLVHGTMMLIIGLLAVEAHRETSKMDVELAAPVDDVEEIYAETLGEQLDTPTPALDENDLATEFDDGYSLSDLPPVDDPLAAPPLSPNPELPGDGYFSAIDAPSIGWALSGREEGRKDALLRAYGGTATTQESVNLALKWLAAQQRKDGLWSLSGPYQDGANSENQLAATAMALLAFLGDGHTHMDDGPYRRNVTRGVQALLKLQGPDGEFAPEQSPNYHRLYTHAQCTIVLCELYAITEDSQIREAARKAVEYCVSIQSPEGGWRYFPFQEADMSVSGWFVMALASARMAQLEVPTRTLDGVSKFLDSVSTDAGSRYKYLPERPASPAMTAEALLCRQFLGWPRDESRLLRGVEYLSQNPVDWQRRDVYYWYYATQVMHHMGGEPWVEWNKVMRQVIPENQVRTGRERGSWDPANDQWGATAGRLYVTCLSTYMLEVYYRHLPLYSLPENGATAVATSSP